jgi:hypothetical protein
VCGLPALQRGLRARTEDAVRGDADAALERPHAATAARAPARAVRSALCARLALQHGAGSETDRGPGVGPGDPVGGQAVRALPAPQGTLCNRSEDAVGAYSEGLLELPDVAAA